MKVISINPQKVTFAKNLALASPKFLASLKLVFGDSLFSLCYSMPPLIEVADGSFTLVGRHFSFAVLVEQTTAKIPGVVLSGDELQMITDAYNVFEEVIIGHATTLQQKARNKSGISRKERKELGYTCPFCRLLVKGPHGHRPDETGKNKGYYRLTCYSANAKKVPCGFQAYLSQEEYILFQQRQYPVHRWLQRAESPCPECGKSLFLRTRFAKKVLLCEDNFSVAGTCKYRADQGEDKK